MAPQRVAIVGYLGFFRFFAPFWPIFPLLKLKTIHHIVMRFKILENLGLDEHFQNFFSIHPPGVAQ